MALVDSSSDELVALVGGLSSVQMDEYAVVGSYMRFGEGVREQLKDARVRIAEACAQPAKRRDNHLLWAAPGSGKTYFVEQVAASLPEINYAELNLAKLDEADFRDGLAQAIAGGPTVCLIDEVDAKPEEPWPYEALMPFLDVNLERGGGIVFVLAGSSGSTIQEFMDRIRARPKGTDVLSRVPEANGWEIAPMEAGDRILVALSQMLNAASELDRPVFGVEKLALHYVAAAAHLANARQLREFAVRAVERGSASNDRIRYDDLFDSGDPENKSYWASVMPEAEPLANSFVGIRDGKRAAPGSSPARTDEPHARLPVPPTPFLGRESELEEVLTLLAREDVRLVTLTGPGGTGKTRLALEAARRSAEHFPDGACWVGLASLREASLLGTSFAQALGVREQPDGTVTEWIVAALADKRILLLVDNCEHLLDAIADLVQGVLESCPGVAIVASSRERLRLRAEHLYAVPPMAPSDGTVLFVARASAIRPDFPAADEHVHAICEAVDGLPLAIELAAARVRALSTAEIHERLAARLPLLTSRDRDLEERQRTLEATIAWSYDLLAGDECRVLRSLAIFAGGCTLEAAEEVGGADLDLLESLLDKSLIRHRIDEAGQDRYWMLETIREYALRELGSHGEADDAERRHTEYYVGLAGGVLAPFARSTTDEQRYRFVADRANFREAHARALVIGDAASALRFVRCLGRVMNMTGSPPTDSYTTGVASLALPGGHAEDRAYALVRTASFAAHAGLLESAGELLSEAEELFHELGDRHGTADAIVWQSELALRMARYEEAVFLGERLAVVAEDLDDRAISAEADEVLGLALLGRALVDGDREAAERGHVLMAAKVAYVVEYEPLLEQAVARANLAIAQFALDEYWDSIATAQSVLRDVVGLDAADVRLVAYPVFAVGLSSYRTSQYGLAVTLLTASARFHREHGFVLESWMSQLLERVQSEASVELDANEYDTAVRAGMALSRDEVVELALSVSRRG